MHNSISDQFHELHLHGVQLLSFLNIQYEQQNILYIHKKTWIKGEKKHMRLKQLTGNMTYLQEKHWYVLYDQLKLQSHLEEVLAAIWFSILKQLIQY